MISEDRRQYPRYALNHPVSMHLADSSERFTARVLDAGISGMRLEVPKSQQMQVGRQFDISCKSVGLDSSADGVEVALRCSVIWQNVQNSQVGLAYLS